MISAKQAIKKIQNIFGFSQQDANHPKTISNEEKAFFNQFIQHRDLVFDVGAHKGQKADIFLALGAKVICIDPQPSCIKILEKKYNQNQNVIIVPKGLSQKEGSLKLSICKQAPTLSTFSESWKTKGRFAQNGCSWEKTVDVEVTTLDNLISLYGVPSFCKIDVEGFEFEVIQGLTQKIPHLSFEFTIENMLIVKNCINHLTTLGYPAFNIGCGEDLFLHSEKWFSATELITELTNLSQSNHELWGDIYASTICANKE